MFSPRIEIKVKETPHATSDDDAVEVDTGKPKTDINGESGSRASKMTHGCDSS